MLKYFLLPRPHGDAAAASPPPLRSGARTYHLPVRRAAATTCNSASGSACERCVPRESSHIEEALAIINSEL